MYTLNIHNVSSVSLGSPKTQPRTGGGTFTTRKITVRTDQDETFEVMLFADDEHALLTPQEQEEARPEPVLISE